jgi:hypothetical protein
MTLILSGTNGLSDVDGDASTPAIRGSDSNTGIFFGTDIIGFSEGGTEAMRINADAQVVAAAGTASLPVITTTGDVNTGIFFPAADTIAFTTGGTTRGRWTTDGLCFNADTAAANALDDYEEGTWDPVLTGGFSTAPTGYTRQDGSYIKIGKYVYCQGRMDADGAVASAGSLRIGGLPFTSGGTANAFGVGVINYQTSFNTNAGDTIEVDANGTALSFWVNTGLNRLGNAANVNINTDIIFNVFYIAA